MEKSIVKQAVEAYILHGVEPTKLLTKWIEQSQPSKSKVLKVAADINKQLYLYAAEKGLKETDLPLINLTALEKMLYEDSGQHDLPSPFFIDSMVPELSVNDILSQERFDRWVDEVQKEASEEPVDFEKVRRTLIDYVKHVTKEKEEYIRHYLDDLVHKVASRLEELIDTMARDTLYYHLSPKLFIKLAELKLPKEYAKFVVPRYIKKLASMVKYGNEVVTGFPEPDGEAVFALINTPTFFKIKNIESDIPEVLRRMIRGQVLGVPDYDTHTQSRYAWAQILNKVITISDKDPKGFVEIITKIKQIDDVYDALVGTDSNENSTEDILERLGGEDD